MGRYLSTTGKLKPLAYEIYQNIKKGYKPIFICVGSDRVIADSLAPLIAEKLKKKYSVPAYVYGGLDYPITAINLSEVINYIDIEHEDSIKVVIDATLGDTLGEVIVTKGVYAGLGKILPVKRLGDFSILGVVGRRGGDFTLKSVRLGVVDRLSEFIAKAIAMALAVSQ